MCTPGTSKKRLQQQHKQNSSSSQRQAHGPMLGRQGHYGTSDTCMDTSSEHKGEGITSHGLVQTPRQNVQL